MDWAPFWMNYATFGVVFPSQLQLGKESLLSVARAHGFLCLVIYFIHPRGEIWSLDSVIEDAAQIG